MLLAEKTILESKYIICSGIKLYGMLIEQLLNSNLRTIEFRLIYPVLGEASFKYGSF
jgi:hypothetical protein